jgi:membrane dipeptidase
MNALSLIASSLTWDNHGCLPLRPHDATVLPQLELYRASHVDVIMVNIGFGEQSVEDHVRMIAHFRHWLADHKDKYLIIETPEDIALARATGRLAVGFNIEGANGISDQISLISLYYDLGVRWMLMAYNRNNRVGGGCQDYDRGLTRFGRKVVEEMARVGMVACCSHTGYRTARDVIDFSPNPVIFSHSNPRSLHDHPRNIPNDLIAACAGAGGVVCLNGIGIFLGKNDNSVETYFRHVDYVVQLVGPDHVGIGLDYLFDPDELGTLATHMTGTFPPGLGYELGSNIKCVSPAKLEALVELQLQAGYSETDIRHVLGQNLLRLAQRVWKPRSDRLTSDRHPVETCP